VQWVSKGAEPTGCDAKEAASPSNRAVLVLYQHLKSHFAILNRKELFPNHLQVLLVVRSMGLVRLAIAVLDQRAEPVAECQGLAPVDANECADRQLRGKQRARGRPDTPRSASDSPARVASLGSEPLAAQRLAGA
jgi:hypothetical protein